MGVKKTDYTVYYQQAEKMIPWSLTFEDWSKGKQSGTDKFIEVPSEEWDDAKNHMLVRMLINEHGFSIRACIPFEKKTVFDPEIRLRDAKPIRKQQVDEGLKTGDMFRVKSTRTRLEVVSCWKDSVDMKYPDGEKIPFKTTKQHIDKQLNFETWEKI